MFRVRQTRRSALRPASRWAPFGALAVSAVLVAQLIAPAAADEATPTPAPPDPAATAPAAPPPAEPTPMPSALGSWCTALFPVKRASTEKREAWELMAGRAKVSDGGIYQLSEHPDWQPQAQTDTSGDRHINSLFWALPLLYRGVRVQNQAMVDRFRNLMHYWIADHQNGRGTWVDASIYGGLRTQTLVCAAQTLNDPVIAAAAARDAANMIKPNYGSRVIAVGTNNTDLIRQVGGLAYACWIGDAAARDKAWANTVAVARGLVQLDGSDVEGSPWYAVYTEQLISDAERAANTCGLSPAPLTELRGKMVEFVAQSTRPDFQLELLGDTVAKPLPADFGAGDPRADFVRSKGAAGSPPQSIYSTFAGGYVFGRAGWQPQPGGPDTYYSMRFTSGRPRTAHTHDDGGGLTIYSRGVPWVTDRGPYRYENASSLRAFVRTRAAHSAVTVGKVARTFPGVARLVRSGSDWQQGGNDNTCVRDDTWKTVTVTRCVTYVRSVDAIIVVDYANAAPGVGKRAKKRFVWERWHLTPGLTASNTSDSVTLASGDKRLDIIKSGPGAWSVDIANGATSIGWQTGKWGERLPAAVLNRKAVIGKDAGNTTLVTVFVPRTDGEQVPVTIDGNGVTITRGGTTVTTPLPAP